MSSDFERSLPGDTPAQRMAHLGVQLPDVAAPAGAYVGHVRTGDTLWIAGQLPLVDGELLAVGRVGDAVDLATARHCARQCALNVLAQVPAAGSRLDDIRRVVRLTVFVASADGFTEQHLVADGASDLIAGVLGEAGPHTRAAVGVAALPRGAPVEVDAVLAVA